MPSNVASSLATMQQQLQQNPNNPALQAQYDRLRGAATSYSGPASQDSIAAKSVASSSPMKSSSTSMSPAGNASVTAGAGGAGGSAGDAMMPVGLTQSANQALKKSVGYTGGFDDPNQWKDWARGNVGAYGQYLQQGRTNPNFKPNVDFNPAQAGVQTYGPAIEKYIGNQIGYYGDNMMGSGFLNNTQNAQAYTQMRQLFEPDYQGYQAPQQNNQLNDFLSSLQNLLSNSQQNSAASTASRPGAMQLPDSLQALQGMTEGQQRSAIATDALYGLGADPSAQSYYLNMLNRSLVDDQGNVNSNFDILPIESNYLQSLGLPISSSQDFLSGLARLYAAGQ